MKVMLIRPPHEHMITTNVPKSVDSETGMYPPLGLLYVAAGLKTWTNAKIVVLDAPAEKLNQKQIAERVFCFKPDVVGIQAMTFTLVDTVKTIQSVKSISPDTHISLGGPHVNLYPQETLSIKGVDSLILGEGERPFADLVNALSDGNDVENIEAVAVIRDGIVNTTTARPLETNLDNLPNPARDLIDNSVYWSVLAKHNPITTAMTSRGCPMKCIFYDFNIQSISSDTSVPFDI